MADLSRLFRPFDPAGLGRFHFLRNLLVVGSVGAGKTTLAKLLVERASQLGDVLVVDVKGEYRDVVAWVREEGGAAEVLAVGRRPRLKLNPLEPPPGVVPSVWAGCVSDIITRCYGLGEPSRRILQDCIMELYRSHGLEGVFMEPVTWPTLRELERAVAHFPAVGGREVNSRRALESRLHLMAAGELGSSLNTMVGFDPTFFRGRVVAVELDWVNSVRDQRVVGELLVGALWEWRKANPAARRRLQVVVLEEAHRFVPEARAAWERGTRTLLERCFAEGRSYGLGLVAVDQQPGLLSRYVIANTGSKFAGRLSSAEDANLVMDTLLMGRRVRPDPLFHRFLPGQMYGQICTSRIEGGPEMGRSGRRGSFHLYAIPRPSHIRDQQEAPQLGEAHTWYAEKFGRAALLNFQRLHLQRTGNPPPTLLLHQLMSFANKQARRAP